jgi:hypothetical protein
VGGDRDDLAVRVYERWAIVLRRVQALLADKPVETG